MRPAIAVGETHVPAADAAEQICYFVPVHSSFGRRRVLASCCRHAWWGFHRRSNGGREEGWEREKAVGGEKAHSKGAVGRKSWPNKLRPAMSFPPRPPFLKQSPYQPGSSKCENGALWARPWDPVWQPIHCKAVLDFRTGRAIDYATEHQAIDHLSCSSNVFGKD